MARPIHTVTSLGLGIRIVNHYVEGNTESTDIHIGDQVDNFEYVQDHDVVTLSGCLASSEISLIPNAKKNYKDLQDPIAERLKIENIVMDCSEQYHSKMVTIPAREILEYHPTDEVKRVEIQPLLTLTLSVKLSDRTISTTDLYEGKELTDVELLGLDGEDVTKSFTIKSFVYTIDAKKLDITVSSIVTEDDEVIDIMRFKNCGKETIEVNPDDFDIQEIINDAVTSTTPIALMLAGGTYEDAYELAGNVTLKGNITTGRSTRGMVEEVALAGTITCADGADVTFENLQFTKDAHIELKNANSITIKDCLFADMTPYQAKSYLIHGIGFFGSVEPTPIRVEIEDCLFDVNPEVDGNKFYNLFEFNFPLAGGSRIVNNKFEKGCATNNLVNVYSIDEYAVVSITDNLFVYSGNAIRVGTLGAQIGVVNIHNNAYQETITDTPAYAGLLIIQPYGSKTVDMSKVKIYLTNTGAPEDAEQIYYAYAGKKDTIMTEDLWPALYVNGKREVITVTNATPAESTTTSV